MNCDKLIDDLVARVNSNPREPLLPDEVPIGLRVYGKTGTDQLLSGFTDWRIMQADHTDRIAALEQRIGLSFPPSFRSLVCRYSFPAFECGPVRLFANTGEPLFWEFQDRLFNDPIMSPQLLAAGYIQIGSPWSGVYDPTCIEVPPLGDEGRVVELCHEALLCEEKLVILEESSPSFRHLVSAVLSEKPEPGVGADSR